jgi:hypothetical protein
MLNVRGLLALGAVCALSGCATPTIDVAYAPISPIAVQVDSVTRTAKPDDVLFEQMAGIPTMARAETTLNSSAETPLAPSRALAIPSGEPLYQVWLKQRLTEKTFCSPSVASFTDFSAQETRWRACASDTDGDGAFDRAWAMDEGVSGWLAPLGPKIRVGGGGVKAVDKPVMPPVKFSVMTPSEIPPVKLRFYYRKDLIAGRFFEIMTVEEGGAQDAGFKRFNADSKTFPFVVNVAGARIKVLGYVGDGVEYQVLNGIPAGSPLALVRLPPDVIYVAY